MEAKKIMIQNKKDYKEFIQADALANHINDMASKMRITWKYIKKLRKYEYTLNCENSFKFIKRIFVAVRRYQYHKIGVKSGIQIPPNTFGKGLYLPHYGTIVVNGTARFGENCVVQCGVNVSEKVTGGDHIYFGAGCKVMTGIHIANDVILGANAVVTCDIEEENIVWGGVPARKISDKGYKNRTAV